MPDVEHIPQRVPAIQAQDGGLSPRDHQRAESAPHGQPGRLIIKALLHPRGQILHVMQASADLLFDDGGVRCVRSGPSSPGRFCGLSVPARRVRVVGLPRSALSCSSLCLALLVRDDNYPLAVGVRQSQAERLRQQDQMLCLQLRVSSMSVLLGDQILKVISGNFLGLDPLGTDPDP